LIVEAISKVYQEDSDPEVEYGRPVTTTDVNNAYRIFYRWFKSATDTGTLPPPVPYSLTADLREVWEKTMDNLGEAGDFLEGAVDKAGKFGILGMFLILASMVIAAVMAAAARILQSIKRFGDYYVNRYGNKEVKFLIARIIERYN
jgi:hypothetical protein